MLKLLSSDDKILEVEQSLAMKWGTIKKLIDMKDCEENTVSIPIPNVTGEILAMVIDYSRHHMFAINQPDDTIIKAFDAKFVDVDQETLFDLTMAANYLDIKNLLDLTCEAVADKIKGRTVEEIRQIFNIKNDFTPEEEAKIHEECAWVFD